MVTVRDVLPRFGPSQLRLYFLMSHYKQDVEYDEAKLDKVNDEFWKLKERAKKVKEGASGEPVPDRDSKLLYPFLEAMNDDFDTPKAVAEFFKLIGEGASEVDAKRMNEYYASIAEASSILGVSMFE